MTLDVIVCALGSFYVGGVVSAFQYVMTIGEFSDGLPPDAWTALKIALGWPVCWRVGRSAGE